VFVDEVFQAGKQRLGLIDQDVVARFSDLDKPTRREL
jgi:hypothetical protein